MTDHLTHCGAPTVPDSEPHGRDCLSCGARWLYRDGAWSPCLALVAVQDGAPADFGTRLGTAGPRTLLLWAWHTPDARINADLALLREWGGYDRLRAVAATAADLARWVAQGYALLWEPPLVAGCRITGWQEAAPPEPPA